MNNGFEKWYPSEPPKNYGMNWIGAASGYMSGHLTTITMQLYTNSLENAKRVFDEAIAKAGLVGITDYHITRKEV